MDDKRISSSDVRKEGRGDMGHLEGDVPAGFLGRTFRDEFQAFLGGDLAFLAPASTVNDAQSLKNNIFSINASLSVRLQYCCSQVRFINNAM